MVRSTIMRLDGSHQSAHTEENNTAAAKQNDRAESFRSDHPNHSDNLLSGRPIVFNRASVIRSVRTETEPPR
jgi:hypothetical protein